MRNERRKKGVGVEVGGESGGYRHILCHYLFSRQVLPSTIIAMHHACHRRQSWGKQSSPSPQGLAWSSMENGGACLVALWPSLPSRKEPLSLRSISDALSSLGGTSLGPWEVVLASYLPSSPPPPSSSASSSTTSSSSSASQTPVLYTVACGERAGVVSRTAVAAGGRVLVSIPAVTGGCVVSRRAKVVGEAYAVGDGVVRVGMLDVGGRVVVEVEYPPGKGVGTEDALAEILRTVVGAEYVDRGGESGGDDGSMEVVYHEWVGNGNGESGGKVGGKRKRKGPSGWRVRRRGIGDDGIGDRGRGGEGARRGGGRGGEAGGGGRKASKQGVGSSPGKKTSGKDGAGASSNGGAPGGGGEGKGKNGESGENGENGKEGDDISVVIPAQEGRGGKDGEEKDSLWDIHAIHVDWSSYHLSSTFSFQHQSVQYVHLLRYLGVF